MAGGADQVVLTNNSASDFVLVGFGTAFAAFSFSEAGVITKKQGASWTTVSGEWWSAGSTSGIGNNYQISASAVGATPTGPALNTWHALSTGREWSLSRSNQGDTSTTLTVSIRDAASPNTVQATASFSLWVIAEN